MHARAAGAEPRSYQTLSQRRIRHCDLVGAELDAARLRAALADDPLAAFHPPQGAASAQIETHRQLLLSERAEQDAKLSSIRRQLAQREAERSTTVARADRYS
jgi:hemolysin D